MTSTTSNFNNNPIVMEVVNPYDDELVIELNDWLQDLIFSPWDVLVGTQAPRNHPGNMMFRGLCANRFEEYDTAPYGTRRRIAETIIEELRNTGGWFINFQTNEELTHEQAIDKVQSTMRCIRKVLQRRRRGY